MNGTQTRAAYFFEQKRVDRLPFLSGWPRVWTKANESAVLETNYSIWRWKQTGVQDRKTTVRGSLPISRLLHFSRLTCYSKFRRFLLALFVCDVVRTYYAYARGAGNYGK